MNTYFLNRFSKNRGAFSAKMKLQLRKPVYIGVRTASVLLFRVREPQLFSPYVFICSAVVFTLYQQVFSKLSYIFRWSKFTVLPSRCVWSFTIHQCSLRFSKYLGVVLNFPEVLMVKHCFLRIRTWSLGIWPLKCRLATPLTNSGRWLQITKSSRSFSLNLPQMTRR